MCGIKTPSQTQSGAALITSLVFLVMLTLMSFTVFNSAVLQGRMTGNLRDRQIAYSAAEAALRDAEDYIRNSGRICGLTEDSADDNDSTTCESGFCYNGAGMDESGTSWLTTPVWDAGYWVTTAGASCQAAANKVIWYSDENCGGNRPFSLISNCSWAIGTYTEPSALPLVTRQPQYLIEGFQKSGEGEIKYYYRITTRAWGARSGTVVTLQSVFTPSN